MPNQEVGRDERWGSVHILLGSSPVQDPSLWDGAARSQGRTLPLNPKALDTPSIIHSTVCLLNPLSG